MCLKQIRWKAVERNLMEKKIKHIDILLTFLSASDKGSCIFKRPWRCHEGQEGNHDFRNFKAVRDSTDLGLIAYI